MKTKTADLTGPTLDWAVAKCEGKNGVLHDDGITRCIVIASASGVYKGTYQPSINWSQGGPIFEREMINVKSNLARMREHPEYNWLSDCPEKRICVSFNGPTPLIAAMRCVVAVNLGDEVDVPDELV